MFARLFAFFLIFALSGCGLMPSGQKAPQGPQGPLRLPQSVNVDDGRSGLLPIHIAALVEGGGVNAGFGSRGYSMGGNGSPKHDGIDIMAANGAAIRAASDGRITDLGWRGNYGRFLLIRHNDRIETAYAHMSRYVDGLAVGQTVRRGEVIAYIGTTGNATGPHLHFEVRRDGKAIDPLAFVSLASQ